MAEALAVIGTVQTLSSVLWDFSLLVGRYRRIPVRLYDLSESLEACEAALDHWRLKWGVEPRQPNLYYEILWSKKGCQNIQRCLAAVGDIANYLEIATRKLVRTAMSYRKSGHRETFEDEYQSELVRRTVRDLKGRLPLGRRFAWAVTSKMDDFDREIERFNTKLITLERFSEYYWETTHPDFTDDDPRRRRKKTQRLLEDQNRQHSIKIAKKTRYDAEILWELCKDMGDVKGHLAITGTDTSSASDSVIGRSVSRELRMLLENGDDAVEWKITRKHSRSPGRHDDAIVMSKMDEAFHNIPRNHKYAQLIPPQNVSAESFTLRRARHSKLQDLRKEHSLSALISPPTNASVLTLSLTDKLTIATALLDGSYRLLGTPWLSYLDATNIRGSLGADQSWLAMLVPDKGNDVLNTALRDMQRFHARRDLKSHAQLFRLGVILAELAAGCRVSYAEASGDLESPGVTLVLPGLSGDGLLDAVDLAARFEASFGATFAGIVQGCLQALADAETMRAGDLDGYYNLSLLEPSRKLTAMCDRPEV